MTEQTAVATPARPVPTMTRDQLATLYQCTHAELGRLLRERAAPLPVRLEGAILWYEDEVKDAARAAKIAALLARRRQQRAS